VIVLMAAVIVNQKRRRRHLQEHFGPEYEHTVEHAKNRRHAEKELVDRQRQRDQLDIRPMRPGARERYSARWASTQAGFVDAPVDAVREAHTLLTEVMRERGYPVEDFDEQASYISVDHPTLVENYRAAHRVYEANRRGAADTEELRQALVHYRSLFDELLADTAEGARDGELDRDGSTDDEQTTTSSGNRAQRA
jgi:hypothetical protein